MTSEAPNSSPCLIDGPDYAPATVLLAHRAGAPMDSPFMAAIAGGLAAAGWRAVRFEFGYMARMRETGRVRPPRGGGNLQPLDQTNHAFFQLIDTPHQPSFRLGQSLLADAATTSSRHRQ